MRFSVTCFLASIFLCLSQPVSARAIRSAQNQTAGKLTGTITDPRGAVIAGAQISAEPIPPSGEPVRGSFRQRRHVRAHASRGPLSRHDFARFTFADRPGDFDRRGRNARRANPHGARAALLESGRHRADAAARRGVLGGSRYDSHARTDRAARGHVASRFARHAGRVQPGTHGAGRRLGFAVSRRRQLELHKSAGGRRADQYTRRPHRFFRLHVRTTSTRSKSFTARKARFTVRTPWTA